MYIGRGQLSLEHKLASKCGIFSDQMTSHYKSMYEHNVCLGVPAQQRKKHEVPTFATPLEKMTSPESSQCRMLCSSSGAGGSFI
jgi:hypothetical protein